MKPKILLGLAILFLAFFIYEADIRPLTENWLPLPALPGGLNANTVFLMLFSLFHAWFSLGGLHTAAFFLLSAVISWGFEQVGVATGLIYGAYHYTDVLGVKLGHVPVLIPLAWFMMIYPSYWIANLINYRNPVGSRGSLGRVAYTAFLSALVMTAWDLSIDPVLSGPNVKAWIWEQGGAYFGIPFQNFAGWMLTTFVVYLAYRLLERSINPRPAGEPTLAIAALPLLAYGGMLLTHILQGTPPEIRLIAPFSMGIPLVIAIERLVRGVVSERGSE